jgi:hypothetical protein
MGENIATVWNVVTTVIRTVAKFCCDTEIIDGWQTVANVQLQQFQPLQTTILTVAKYLFSCSVWWFCRLLPFRNLSKHKIDLTSKSSLSNRLTFSFILTIIVGKPSPITNFWALDAPSSLSILYLLESAFNPYAI